MQHSGALAPFADARGLTVMAPFDIEGIDKVPASRAPSVGQHSTAVLAEAGYSAADIDRLRDLGAIA
jgi:crotonobetainyl-CoA:carnitine CoA-transferase CaiB-like acyl-CoA transferase